jgi:hypothetical protein
MSYPLSRARARTAIVSAAGLACATGARPARCPADLAGVLDVLPWRGAQLVAVSGAEVDFVVGSVEGEPDRALGRAGIEVVDEQRLDLLGHRAY